MSSEMLAERVGPVVPLGARLGETVPRLAPAALGLDPAVEYASSMPSCSPVQWRPIDEWDGGFGWLMKELVGRASHALLAGGRVWLVDPVAVAGLDERIGALGEPAGVIQLLDRHKRDCAAVAAHLAVPHVRAWEGLANAPFDALPVFSNRVWREVALWDRATRTLVCADALGTLPYFLAPGERVGWHPLVRPFPPRSFASLRPERILVGHGEGVLAGATDALQDLAASGRRRLPRAWLAALRTTVSAASRRRAPARSAGSEEPSPRRANRRS
jgi:hypothetical protein